MRHADVTLLKTLKCSQCGAPLTPHRFGLSARCDYCQTTTLIDSSGVDAEALCETRKSYQRQIEQWPLEVAARGSKLWAPTGQSFVLNSMRLETCDAIAWPSERALLCFSLNENASINLASTRDAIEKLEFTAEELHRQRYPFLPRVVDCEHDKFLALKTQFGHRFPFSHVAKVYGALPAPASVWAVARWLELAAWVHQLGFCFEKSSCDDVVFSAEEHGLSVISYSFAKSHASHRQRANDIQNILSTVAQMTEGLEVRNHFNSLNIQENADALEVANEIKKWGRAHFGTKYFPLSRLMT